MANIKPVAHFPIEVDNMVESISKKTSHLAGEALNFEKNQGLRDLNWEEYNKKTVFNLKIINNDIQSMKFELENNLKLMNNIIQLLRITITDEEYDFAKRKVENWPVNEFVTKNEFEKMLGEAILNRQD